MGLDMYLIQNGKDVGYWRKANQIHGWFVHNVQNGEDDCKAYPVNKEQLLELKKQCEKVLINKDNAADILPPTPGFFFGSYQIDDLYFDDLRQTIDIVTAIEFTENFDDIYYQSSW